MSRPTDIRCIASELYFLPVNTRLPLKFGLETVTFVTCARACVKVADAAGRTAEGWGETPLSVTWVWPSRLPYEERHLAMREFCVTLAGACAGFAARGHPIEIGADFQQQVLPALLKQFNAARAGKEPMPWLAALVCLSLFDIAIHDAYGNLHGRSVYETYNEEFMSRPLSDFLKPAEGSGVSFKGQFPADFLVTSPRKQIRAWHLVGGVDALDESELTGSEPQDGFPVLLADWIKTDGVKCLKVKLRGDDERWDFARLLKVGRIALAHDVEWLSADFNCTVTDPLYVDAMLDRLRDEHPRLFGMLLYIEQPFPYNLEKHRIDVRSVSARKPLFLDESAHDWKHVALGRELGWSGVALKTCKTQTGALLSLCWAKAHGMTLMVQDLTNPMLAMIPHVLLAANAGTIMGVEVNSMQFYPEASKWEAKVHPGLYQRREGKLDLSTIEGPGFGYQLRKIRRHLPIKQAGYL